MSFAGNALAIFSEVMGDFFLLFLFLFSWVREETRRNRRAEARKLVKGFRMTDRWDGQGCVSCDFFEGVSCDFFDGVSCDFATLQPHTSLFFIEFLC